VYSTDLPQVEQLEHYRPSSVTELYDDQSRVIGTFALQRRVVAAYDDYPEVLRNALVSIEDKDFYAHSGINFWRIAGAAYRDIESGGKVQGASTLTMQLARNLFLFTGSLLPSQNPGSAVGRSDGTTFHQAADFHSTPTRSFSAMVPTDSKQPRNTTVENRRSN
jgi:membrane peptidoglycan carboxypeptidase